MIHLGIQRLAALPSTLRERVARLPGGSAHIHGGGGPRIVQSGPPAAPTRSDLVGRGDDAVDQALIVRIAARNREAFELLYARYAGRVGGYLWKLTGRRDLADEALNDVLMLVWQKAPDFQPRGRVSSWIFTLAHLRALKARDRVRRHENREAQVDEARIADPNITGGDAEEQLDRRRRLQLLRGEINRLSFEHRSVLELAFVEGHSYAEVARILDCPVNTVKTRIYHARKRLLGSSGGAIADDTRS